MLKKLFVADKRILDFESLMFQNISTMISTTYIINYQIERLIV